MPTNKDLKRQVRARMRKTGESYTSARARLLDKKSPRGPSREDFAALAGMSDAAVRARTGREWEEWVRWLDEMGAAGMPHKAIAECVYQHHKDHGVTGWWAQSVTVGYERIRGLREVGQRRGGSFDANKSKTLPVPVSRLYRAFSEKRMRARWLAEHPITIRTSTKDKSMRITWEDGTQVDAYFTAKGEAKSQVALQHRKLASKADVERQKAFWHDRLTELAAVLAK